MQKEEMQRIEYRGYFISYDPPPIPIRCHDWKFWHDSYDGAPIHSLDLHSPDPRCGTSASLEEAKRDIDELYEDYPEWH